MSAVLTLHPNHKPATLISQVVDITGRPMVAGYRNGRGQVLVICPHCGCIHAHGCEPGTEPGDDIGSRAAHCYSSSPAPHGEYRILVVGWASPELIKERNRRERAWWRRHRAREASRWRS